MGNRQMKKKATVTSKTGLKQIFLVEFPPIHSFHGLTNTCNIERLKKKDIKCNCPATVEPMSGNI